MVLDLLENGLDSLRVTLLEFLLQEATAMLVLAMSVDDTAKLVEASAVEAHTFAYQMSKS
jgi:hypothetical protein